MVNSAFLHQYCFNLILRGFIGLTLEECVFQRFLHNFFYVHFESEDQSNYLTEIPFKFFIDKIEAETVVTVVDAFEY